MSLQGAGAVAIWHDIAAEGRDAFYAWHCLEHMPERVAIPGFRRGRRFIAIDADREFFNLYETRDAEVVRGDAYRQRLENPTPLTLATVRHFRAVARALCSVAATMGRGDGGTVATLRYSMAAGAAALEAEVIDGLLPALLALPGTAAASLCVADPAASGFVNAEQRARGGANEVPTHTVIVEGCADEAPFMAAIRATLARFASLASNGALGFYRHQVTIAAP